jgi:hypothetical protein
VCPLSYRYYDPTVLSAALALVDVDFAEDQIERVLGESNSDLFGGNSNRRGSIWLPTNYTLVQELEKFPGTRSSFPGDPSPR